MSQCFSLADYAPHADGLTDDTPALEHCFAAVREGGGGVVTIPPGDYRLRGASAIPLSSGTTVLAAGARFHLPEELGDQARLVLFAGEDVRDFAWHGGHFAGRCFDPGRADNTWEPNANTRALVFTTTPGGVTANLTFRDVTAHGVAGAVINVEGVGVAGSESAVSTFATNVTVQDCRLEQCGKFMWDYGLLWQIMVWPEEYTAAEVALAQRYFRHDLVRPDVRLAAGDDRVCFDNTTAPLPLSDGSHGPGTVCLYGPELPANIIRGRLYHVVDTQPGHVRLAETPGGPPLVFAGAAGPGTGLIHNLSQAFYHLYIPVGAGPGKGAVDLVCCRRTVLTGNVLSALGDTMHLQRCHDNVFSGNHITGSRMGAFFLAEYCKHSTVSGNTVDGTNGSRVMSVEKSSENVTITGNIFRNGGRGSWINQPRNLILQGNVFVNNTTKCERDPHRGRKSFVTGDYERYSEVYFTLHEADGQYGPVIVRDNIFETGPEAEHTLTFAGNGHHLVVEGNVFTGGARSVVVEPDCTKVRMGPNLGLPET